MNPTSPPQSRRQRLLGLARATRDTYIPRIATTVQLQFRSPTEFDEFGAVVAFPLDTTFTLFPSYTRSAISEDGTAGYKVGARGWMWCPGTMSRKNRLILSLAKQVARVGGNSLDLAAAEAAMRLDQDPQLKQDTLIDSDVESLLSSSSASASLGNPSLVSETDMLVRERLSSFIAKSIPRAELQILVGAEDSKVSPLVSATVYTDGNGHFDTELFVPYRPSVVQVNAVADPAVCAFEEVVPVPLDGLGIISDIDDTVKLTGVIGDKRELMRKLLVGDMLTWRIPEVVDWFASLRQIPGTTFHYVSNSPWQLYNLIREYFTTANLPPGSFHLKQYTGNIISSLMEPSTSRKRNTLSEIVADFPNKRFICVGDSGEHDLDAYADLAKAYPGQIAAIYIRCVPDSFSDVDDEKILEEITWLVKDWTNRQAAKPKHFSGGDLIDLTDAPVSTASSEKAAKLPPLVPKKPLALKSGLVTREPPPPPLPERRYLQKSTPPSPDHARSTTTPNSASPAVSHSISASWPSKASSPPPPPPPPPRLSSSAFPSISPIDSPPGTLGRLYDTEEFFELEDVDKKGAAWLARLTSILHNLDGTGTKLRFFKDSDKQFFKEALLEIR